MGSKKRGLKGLTNKVELARFETLKYLQEGLSISEIAKLRKISRTAVYKVLSTLIKYGLVSNPKRSMYELTDKGLEGLHSFVALRYNLRQHNLAIKIKVLESPRNWAQRRQELRRIPYFNKTLRLKNNEQDYFNYGKLWIKTTTKSVIIKIPTVYAKNWETALIQAMNIFEGSIPKIEKLFSIRLTKDFKANITFISNEYAILQDALARVYRSEGSRLYLTGDDGKIWLITDFSFTTDETEFIHSDRACDDVDAIAPFLNDLRKNPITISKIRQETKEVLQVAQAHSQNIVKHQRVLDEILTAFKKINKRLDKAGL